jgi:hypothetical protein
MREDGAIIGNTISLVTFTKSLWHEFYRNYEIDPMMDTTPYMYDFERMEKFCRFLLFFNQPV